jgi:hypothetical protein
MGQLLLISLFLTPRRIFEEKEDAIPVQIKQTLLAMASPAASTTITH